MKKIIIAFIVVVGVSVGVLLAYLILNKTHETDSKTGKTGIILYADTQGVVKSKEEEFTGELTVDALAEALSKWSGLDYKINDVKISDDSAYVDWAADSTLLSGLGNRIEKDGFRFDDINSLQWFMLDSLAQTIMRNLGLDHVFFTMNNGEPLQLNIIILIVGEPYMGSAYYRGDELGEGHNTYFDDKNKFLLTYPAAFSETPIDEIGGIGFDSTLDGSKMQYWVIPNTYNDTANTFIDSIIWDESRVLDGSVVIGRGVDTDPDTGEKIFFASYSLVEENRIAIITVKCEYIEDASTWYKLMENKDFNIFNTAGMDAERGEEGETHYSYFDDINQLLLTYSTVFSKNGTVDKKGNVNFASTQDKSTLCYWVVPNTYNDTPESFQKTVAADKAELIAGNMVVGKGKDVNLETGKTTPSAYCWLVEDKFIAIARVACENSKEAAVWYNNIKDGVINIDNVSAFDSEDGNDVNNGDNVENSETVEDYYSYLDVKHQTLLTYTSVFSKNAKVTDSYISFESANTRPTLLYWDIANTNKFTVDEFLEIVVADKAELLHGNSVIGRRNDIDPKTGEVSPCVMYWMVKKDRFAVACIVCNSDEEADKWYDLVKDGAVNIDDVTGFDTEGVDDYSYNTYSDNENQLILSYPTLFSGTGGTGIVNNEAYIQFSSTQDDSQFVYLVTPNTDGDSPKSYIDSVDVDESDVLNDNVAIAKINADGSGTNGNGDISYYIAYYWIDAERVAMAFVDCEGAEEASKWYNLFKTGAVDIKPANSANDNSGAKDDENDVGDDSPSNASLADAYKIMIDGENVTTKMNLTMINNTLYAETKSYVDALSIYGNPILYCQDNEKEGTLDIYSWATDVVIMYIEQGTNTLYRLTDDLNDEFEEVELDEHMITNENGEILVPVKAMTKYLISSQQLEASIEE